MGYYRRIIGMPAGEPSQAEQRYYPPQVSPGGMVYLVRRTKKWVWFTCPDWKTEHPSKMLAADWDKLAFTLPVPAPRRMQDWLELRVILSNPATTGEHHFPAGTEMTVIGHYRGRLNLAVPGSRKCVSGVPRWGVQIIGKESKS